MDSRHPDRPVDAFSGGNDGSAEPADVPSAPDDGAGSCGIVQLTLGVAHSCALQSDGHVVCWGFAGTAKGAGTMFALQGAATSPGIVAGVSSAKEISASGVETCALDATGSVKCWRGGAAALDGPLAELGFPADARPLTLSLGGLVNCARATDRTYCWGENAVGLLGDGTFDGSKTPRPVDDADGVSSGALWIGAGLDVACAIRGPERSPWCWGRNEFGALGVDRIRSREVPGPVLGVTSDVTKIGMAGNGSCALKTDGAVICWGGGSGDLSEPQLTRSLPQEARIFAKGSGVVDLSRSGIANHMCAIKSDRSLWCWGGNLYGQSGGPLPVPLTTAYSLPKQVLPGVSQVATGENHTCALKEDGTVWCWGRNNYSQLGDAVSPGAGLPQQVPLVCRRAVAPAAPVMIPSGRDGGATDGASSGDAGGSPVIQPGGPWVDRTPRLLPQKWPVQLGPASMTFDRARGRLVLMNGNQLWEWEAAGGWTNLSPTHVPIDWPAAPNGGLVYDEKRAVAQFLGEDWRSWQWDGSGTWRDNTPLPLPVVWPYGVTVLDAGRDRLIKYRDGFYLWEADPATLRWEFIRTPKEQPGGIPAIVGDFSFVYDRDRKLTVLLFGKGDGVQVHDWNGVGWTDRSVVPPGEPHPPAWQFKAGYDEARKVVTLLRRGATAAESGAVWEWDGATGKFAQRAAADGVKPWPPAGSQTVAYDSVRQKLVSFGWNTSTDLWEWDGATASWSDLTPKPVSLQWPEKADTPIMFADSLRGRALLFHSAVGQGPAATSHDLYEWDGAGNVWILRTPFPRPTWPSDRKDFSVAVDSDRNRVVLFGGAPARGGARLNELWEMDLATFAWTNLTPTPLPPSWPPARASHGMAYDKIRRRVVVFGGLVVDGFVAQPADLWEWDVSSSTWTDRTAPPAIDGSWPNGRLNASFVYDDRRGRVVLFGGQTRSSTVGETFNDVWDWDGASGRFVNRTIPLSPDLQPQKTTGHAAAYDPVRGRMVTFGVSSLQAPFGSEQTWEWNGDDGTWSRRAVRSAHPSSRERPGMAYDASRQRMVLFGGTPVIYPIDDQALQTWEYDGSVVDP